MALLEGIFAHVLQAPTATALLWFDPLEPKQLQVWTYRQVWAAASRAASLLVEMARTRPATHVGMMLAGRAALPVLELATLLATLVIIPLGTEPLPRLALMVEDAAPLLAIIAGTKQMDLARQLTELAEGCILMPASELCVMEQDLPAESCPAAPDPGSVSHIFFTSGSTGRPKGCICSFQNLFSYCEAKNKVHQVERDSVVFVASAHTFDPSLGDFFSTWLAGACVALAPDVPLGRSLEATRASHVQTTPAHFATVEVDRKLMLRTVALGGELMPQQIVDDWAGRVRLLNTYGVTECTVYQAAAVFSPESSRRELGAPLPGLSLFLAAKKGDDPSDCVEDGSGEIGELWIAGPQVGLGYLRRPELTLERFQVVPQIGRCFRSGDLAVAKEATDTGRGWQLMGRRDGMVKLRGRRVELGEIEEVILAAAPDLMVAAAAVLAEKLLVIYCVLRGDLSEPIQKVTCNFLQRRCEERLPQHMVPARILPIAELPLTSSGKVSRRQLAQLPLPWEEVAPPLGGAEIVASAWHEVLGVPVSKRSNFLALGGDSMAALRVCQLLANRCGATSGTFGEELPEPLLPAHLLSKPRLQDFLQHLQRFNASLGALALDEVTKDLPHETDGLETFEELTDIEILHHAAGLGAIGLVQAFLKMPTVSQCSTLTSANVLGTRTPLHAACMNGQVAVVKLLLEARASATCPDRKGVQPIHLAAQSSREVVGLLLSARAKLDAMTHEKQTALHFAARAGASGAIVDEVLKVPKDKGKGKGSSSALKVDARDMWGRSALHWAVVNGHRSMVVKLLDAGADRSLSDHQGETALAVAERRAQCRAQDRPAEMGASVGDLG